MMQLTVELYCIHVKKVTSIFVSTNCKPCQIASNTAARRNCQLFKRVLQRYVFNSTLP